MGIAYTQLVPSPFPCHQRRAPCDLHHGDGPRVTLHPCASTSSSSVTCGINAIRQLAATASWHTSTANGTEWHPLCLNRHLLGEPASNPWHPPTPLIGQPLDVPRAGRVTRVCPAPHCIIRYFQSPPLPTVTENNDTSQDLSRE